MTMPEDRDADLSIHERRRAIFERAVQKYRALGTPIDADPDFVRLINEWIDGGMEMKDVARMASVSDRGRISKSDDIVRAKTTSESKTFSQEELLSELDRIIGADDL